MAILLLSLSLPFFAENLGLLFVTLPAAMVAVLVLRIVNKGDPQWVAVYQRSLRYRDFYPAKAHFSAPAERNWSRPFG